MFQRKILYAILVFFILCCDGLLYWTVETDRERTFARGMSQLEASTRLLAAHGARALEASDALLKRMGDGVGDWDLADPAQGAKLWRQLSAHVLDSPQIGSAWVLDSAANIVLDNWHYPVKPANYGYRDYYSAHTGNDRGLYLGLAQMGTTHGLTRFTVSRAVRHPDGRLKAVVVAGIFSNYFASGFMEAGLPEDTRVVLVNGRGEVLARWPDSVESPAPGAHRVFRQPLGDFNAAIEVSVPFAPLMEPWARRAAIIGAIGGMATLLLGALVAMGLRGIGREEAYRRRLEAQNQNLEGRVEARTRELNRALESAHTANRAKDVFLATVSHDLRQPLQAMSLLAEVVASTARDESMRNLADQVSTSLTYGQRLLGDLVDLAQLEAGVAKVAVGEVAVAEVLEPLVAEAAATARSKGIGVALHCPGGMVRSDPDRLRQMIQNLLSNAIKNTPEGGRVVVGCRRSGANMRIGVWDTGPGIPPDKLDAIFEQFYQLGNEGRNSAHGVGLGLAIVRRTADLLGHRILVRSQPGRGSMFAIEVPLCQAAASRPRMAAA